MKKSTRKKIVKRLLDLDVDPDDICDEVLYPFLEGKIGMMVNDNPPAGYGEKRRVFFVPLGNPNYTHADLMRDLFD